MHSTGGGDECEVNEAGSIVLFLIKKLNKNE